ncbi:hypothetical protein HPU229334_00880, partial [Helicobacter pullorum]
DALIDTITILPMAKVFKAKKIVDKAKTIYNKISNIISKDKNKKDVRIAKPKPKSLSRQEVLGIVDKLPRNPKEFRRKLVNSKEELDKLWERLTKNAKDLEPKSDKRYGMPIYRRELDDGTVIQYKKASTSRGSVSGGETIEINSQNPRENLRSIHIKK